MKKSFNIEDQNKKLEVLYRDTQNWKSNLKFLEDEAQFISQLLNSYVFEPNTPNLFERLQDYGNRMTTVSQQKNVLNEQIANHEKSLGGMLECKDETCDFTYYNKHEELQNEVDRCLNSFKEVKAEIFNYAGGILKNRKEN
ncbi:hypothetical protein HCG49_11400 [Arenibacter sp. 6A1]|uniref:hypothetical protein n=1 Tax=Arenibacter sp. 6A1 TaxID=2720391 RepID=UPI00144717CF|nr:hypothetical protein [Arenibacter sp. 6A1]NKI27168.1 hypothetical protein [Arenibacter sp. 6A1]